MLVSADQSQFELVNRQFGACLLVPSFFDDFYEDFFNRSQEIRQLFSKTDMAAQKKLLHDGLLYLLMYASGKSTMAKTHLDRLGKTHSRSGLGIKPVMYSTWIESLIKTVERHHEEFKPSDAQAWREVLKLGTDRISSAY